MWLFKSKRKTSLEDSGFFQGFEDWHSHILPGVDDGIKTMDEALAVLRYYEMLGVHKVWLTPHIMEDYPNATVRLREIFEELCDNWDGKVKLALGSENMLDSLFRDRLDNNDLIPLGDDEKHLLVETSCFNPPLGLESILNDIENAGYFPILAHPERYNYMGKDDYIHLKDRGVLFQTNVSSFAGAFGSIAQKKAEWLLEERMIDYTGTDLHRLGSFRRISGDSQVNKSILDKLPGGHGLTSI